MIEVQLLAVLWTQDLAGPNLFCCAARVFSIYLMASMKRAAGSWRAKKLKDVEIDSGPIVLVLLAPKTTINVVVYAERDLCLALKNSTKSDQIGVPIKASKCVGVIRHHFLIVKSAKKLKGAITD